MKELILAVILLMPLCSNAQSVLTPQEQLEKAKKEAEAAKKAVKEAKKQAKLAAKKAKMKSEDTENSAINEEIRKTRAEERTKATPATKTANSNSGWVIPQSPAKETTASKHTTNSPTATKLDWKHNPKYLTGAVPQNESGKVVFTLDIEVPGKSAQQVYDAVYNYLNNMAQEEGQQNSRIVLVNQDKGVIVAKYTEWLTFSESFLSLDRTLFHYTIIGTCTDNHLHLTLERISYDYGKGNPNELKSSAEDYITDKHALNKKQTAMVNGPAKFRKKTIDRKNQIFDNITQILQ